MRQNKAVALVYRDPLPAPFIIAKGKGELAEKILKLAEEGGVEIVKDRELAERLFYVETGEWIPEDCYEIIAELLVFVYRVKSKK